MASSAFTTLHLLSAVLPAASAFAAPFDAPRRRCLRASTLASFVSPAASTRTARGAPSATTIGRCNLQNNNDYEYEGSAGDVGPSTKSIGDVVQNLHGGKYQFSETQYLAGGSAAGRQFAESLYAGGDGSDNVVDGWSDEDDELPKWAMRLREWEEQGSKPVVGTLVFDESNTRHAISISNDERSWERYYAFVLPNEGVQCFTASPATGTLAPRGGASNACDEARPYSDSATISVEWMGDGGNGGDWLLVVGTEAEVWRYRLDIR